MYGYIYKTTNLINNKKYIGKKQSEKFVQEYLGSGRNIRYAIKKYGFENFEVEVLEECNSLEELNECEIKWIAFYGANKSSEFYKIASGGDGGALISDLKNREPEAYKKFIEKCKERTGEKNPNYGNGEKIKGDNNPSKRKEVRERLSKTSSGKNNAMYGVRRERHPMYGKKHSEETKQKIREATIKYFDKKGRKPKKNPITKEEFSKICSKAQQKRYENPEERKKMAKYGKENPNYGNGEKVSGGLNGRATKVICIETGEIFQTITEAAKHAGYKDKRTFSEIIKKGKKSYFNKLTYKIIDNTEVSL